MPKITVVNLDCTVSEYEYDKSRMNKFRCTGVHSPLELYKPIKRFFDSAE